MADWFFDHSSRRFGFDRGRLPALPVVLGSLVLRHAYSGAIQNGVFPGHQSKAEARQIVSQAL